MASSEDPAIRPRNVLRTSVTSESPGELGREAGAAASRTSESLAPFLLKFCQGTSLTSESLGFFPAGFMPMIVELEPELGGCPVAKGRRAGRRRRRPASPPSIAGRDVGLGHAKLEFREIDIIRRCRCALPHSACRDLQVKVGEREVGVGTHAATAGQLVDVGFAESPGAAVEEGADLALLGLELQARRRSCPGRGRLRSRVVELSHGRGPPRFGRDRPAWENQAVRFGIGRGGGGADAADFETARPSAAHLSLRDELTIDSIEATSGAWLLNSASLRSQRY